MRNQEQDTAMYDQPMESNELEQIGDHWDTLLELGVSEQTLQIVSDIVGYKIETMLDILYAATGYKSFEQIS